MAKNKRLATQAEGAVHFGVSPSLITRRKKQGKLVMRGALVDLNGSAKAFTPTRSVNDAETFAAAQTRKESTLADLRQREPRKMRGELVSVDDMAGLWSNVGQLCRDGMLSLPDKVSAELAALTDARQIRAQLLDEVRRILANLPAQIHEATGFPLPNNGKGA